MKTVLASASPRRRELLKNIVSDFCVHPFSGEENLPHDKPARYVKALARLKASEVARLYPDATVVGADTVVVHGGRIIGKPADEKDAFEILKELSGSTHSVYTGVCVISNGRQRVFVQKSRVRFYTLTDNQINDYIASGSPMDKAGAYGIQDSGFVANIRGSYTNVMGLPVEKLRKILKKEGRNG